MGHEQFVAIMPYISADLVNMIVQKQNITEADALNKLYSSRLYGKQRYGNIAPICCTLCSLKKNKQEA